ncbi:TetR/AcrR family transcriptional regulator [Streptomyces sp. NBC_01455]|uniref:TetR/AcrR family transcriptional regulator n=1 Tax=Streptomyces sp. NBC_01455 TaxID=2903874 RepID=UPI002E2F4FC7|nr:hypothetical protein [Streptomyces sp. NBC_01455]
MIDRPGPKRLDTGCPIDRPRRACRTKGPVRGARAGPFTCVPVTGPCDTFGSKEGLVCAYLESRSARIQDLITRTLTRFRTPRERLPGVFDAQGEMFTDPEYDGCAFARATSETADNSSISRAAADYRSWLRGLLTDLAAEAGYADSESLARQLHLLFDGTGWSAAAHHRPAAKRPDQGLEPRRTKSALAGRRFRGGRPTDGPGAVRTAAGPAVDDRRPRVPRREKCC